MAAQSKNKASSSVLAFRLAITAKSFVSVVVAFDATQIAFSLSPPSNVSGTPSPAAHLRQRMYLVTTAASLYLKCLTELSPK